MASIITETVEFWDENYDVQINEEEARQAIKNITGFFQILNEWEHAERSIGRETTLKYDSKGK